jgi:uncharacterized protein YndB with AHSA1/START domain
MDVHTQAKTTDDRIEIKTLLRASRGRVWRALSNPQELGTWFGVRLEDASFTPGARVTGTITPTAVDPEVAKEQRPYEGMRFDMLVDRVEPERLFSFRWHPYAVEGDTDFTSEPTTLVTFTLDEARDGVQLTITESGFERVPVIRRAEALESNQQGWTKQAEVIQKYLARS